MKTALRTLTLLVATGLMATAQARGQEMFDQLYRSARELAADPAVDRATIRRAYGKALRAFLQIPTTATAYGPRLSPAGRAALEAGRADLALQLITEAMARSGPSEELAAVQLRALLDANDREGFLVAGRDAAERFPPAIQDAVAADRGRQRLLGWADGWLRGGRTAEALWLFREIAAAGNPFDLANLALALRHAGRLADCEATYRRAVDAAPGDHIIGNDYGLFLRAVGRPEEALQMFRQSYNKEDRPGDGPAITNILHLALLRPDLVPEPPLEEAASALGLRPDSAMLRRVALDLLLGCRGPFPPPSPDNGGRER